MGYTRYSTEEQGSTAEQRAINEMVAADHGVTLLETFTDEGVSRTLTDRPGLQELFDYLEAHRDVRYWLVNELERITAGVGQRQKITSLCKRLGITLVAEDIGLIDPHDEDAMYDADVRAVNAEGRAQPGVTGRPSLRRADSPGGLTPSRPQPSLLGVPYDAPVPGTPPDRANGTNPSPPLRVHQGVAAYGSAGGPPRAQTDSKSVPRNRSAVTFGECAVTTVLGVGALVGYGSL